MLSKCANPSCSVPFRYLHEGRLFRVTRAAEKHNGNGNIAGYGGKRPQQLEYYWLCDVCASQMTIKRDDDGSIRAVPLLVFRAAS